MAQIKEFARLNHVPIMLDDGLIFLLNYIEEHNFHNILEIGTAIGYSSMQMAKISKDIKIDTIEINPDVAKEAISNIEIEGLSDQITVINMDALEYETDKMYDLVFIDAAKGKYRKYLERFNKNSNIFLFDNLEFHGMVDDISKTQNRNTIGLVKKIRIFRDEILQDPNYIPEYHKHTGDGILVLKKKPE